MQFVLFSFCDTKWNIGHISKMFKMSSPAHAHKDDHIVQMLKLLIRTHIYVSCEAATSGGFSDYYGSNGGHQVAQY